MPNSICKACHGTFYWDWTEAFDKFGFGDGANTLTSWVVSVLEDAGYEVQVWDTIHNPFIDSIKEDRRELIPASVKHGYDDPHDYLPVEIFNLLKEADYV